MNKASEKHLGHKYHPTCNFQVTLQKFATDSCGKTKASYKQQQWLNKNKDLCILVFLEVVPTREASHKFYL